MQSVNRSTDEIKLIVATPDSDMLVSLLIFLREEPHLRVVGAASELDSLTALTQSTAPDILLIDEALVDELLLTENDAEAGKFFQSNESRPRLIVMASEEIASDLPVDAVVPKHAPPALLLEVLTLNRNRERKNV